MKSLPNKIGYRCRHAQRGVVLFFALIALVVMSLAAVALIRSVDTNTMIAGNLAFKQAATTSGDSGVEGAVSWLAAAEALMVKNGLSVYRDTTHVFNNDDPTQGYYSNADPALSLTNSAVWDAIDPSKVPEIVDQSGNKIRYIIQRMCRDPNQILSKTNCEFSSAAFDGSEHTVQLPPDVCPPPPNSCPDSGQSPPYRITSRIVGPANTLSYVQAFVY